MRHAKTDHHPSPIQAVLYICVVSTDEQADHGVSLEAQEAKLRAYYQRRGLNVA